MRMVVKNTHTCQALMRAHGFGQVEISHGMSLNIRKVLKVEETLWWLVVPLSQRVYLPVVCGLVPRVLGIRYPKSYR